MRLRLTLLHLVALLVLAPCVWVEGRKKLSPAELRSAIERILNKVRKCRNSPGVSVVVVQDGETILAKGFGKADIEKDLDVDEHTIFPIASVSKQMTATLMALILEKHKMSWETKVRDILPNFVMPTDYETLKTSLEDLISHRTGLPDNDMMWLAKAVNSFEEIYERLRYTDTMYEFRNHFLYNSNTYSVMGEVCKKLTGLSFEEAMKRWVFRPLNMKSSTFYNTSSIGDPRFAKPYMKDGKEPLHRISQLGTSNSIIIAPGGGIATTAADMAKYLKFLVSRGRLPNGTRYTFPKTLNDLFNPLMVMPPLFLGGYLELPVSPHKRTLKEYAHGWVLGTYRDHQVVSHAGNLYGYDGQLALYLDAKSAVYTVVNGPTGREAVINNLLIHDYISDLLLGYAPWLNETTVCTYPAPWKQPGKQGAKGGSRGSKPPLQVEENLPPTLPLRKYVGTYGNLAQGNVTVLINKTTGLLQLNYGELARWKLFPSKEDNVFNVEIFGPLSYVKEWSTKVIPFAKVRFDSLYGDEVDSLSVTMLNYGHPPKFHRGLRLSDGRFWQRPSDCNFEFQLFNDI